MAYTFDDPALTAITGTPNGDDYFGVDGATAGPRKIALSRFALKDQDAVFSAKVISGGNTGFRNATFSANVANPIWCFENASTYGLSYYQGSAYAGGEGIGFHFGTVAAPTHFLRNNGDLTITGGLYAASLSLTTDLAVTHGGTGASTAAAARTNLLPAFAGNGGKVLAVNSGATDVEYVAPMTTGKSAALAIVFG